MRQAAGLKTPVVASINADTRMPAAYLVTFLVAVALGTGLVG